MNQRKTISVLLRVNSYCGHLEHTKGCIYCEDAQRVYDKLLDIQRQTVSDTTKVDVIGATNNIVGEKFAPFLPGQKQFDRLVDEVLRAMNTLRIFEDGPEKAAYVILHKALVNANVETVRSYKTAGE